MKMLWLVVVTVTLGSPPVVSAQVNALEVWITSSYAFYFKTEYFKGFHTCLCQTTNTECTFSDDDPLHVTSKQSDMTDLKDKATQSYICTLDIGNSIVITCSRTAPSTTQCDNCHELCIANTSLSCNHNIDIKFKMPSESKLQVTDHNLLPRGKCPSITSCSKSDGSESCDSTNNNSYSITRFSMLVINLVMVIVSVSISVLF